MPVVYRAVQSVLGKSTLRMTPRPIKTTTVITGGGGGGSAASPTTGQIWPRGSKA